MIDSFKYETHSYDTQLLLLTGLSYYYQLSVCMNNTWGPKYWHSFVFMQIFSQHSRSLLSHLLSGCRQQVIDPTQPFDIIPVSSLMASESDVSHK